MTGPGADARFLDPPPSAEALAWAIHRYGDIRVPEMARLYDEIAAFDWLDVPAPEPSVIEKSARDGVLRCRDCNLQRYWLYEEPWAPISEARRAYHRHHYFQHQFVDPSEVR